MRRKVGGAPWSADLVEHAVFVEIPPEIAPTRPMRVLKDTFADGVHLRNDLFSYQRETEQEGEINNCVLVVERFLDVRPAAGRQPRQRPPDLPAAPVREHLLHRAVIRCSRSTAWTRLTRENVLRYVKGLQDWQSGGHEWHMRSSRYMNKGSNGTQEQMLLGGPTGLGTAAARLGLAPRSLGLRVRSHTHTPYKRVGPTKLPEFYMPYPIRMNPHLEASRRNTIEWARRMGMLDSIPGVPGLGLWNERRLAAFDFPLCAAALHPDATLPELDISSGWLTWGTYGDDYFPAYVWAHPRHGRSEGVRREALGVHAGDDSDTHPGAAQRGGAWSGGPVDPHLSADVPERQAPVPQRRRGNGPKAGFGSWPTTSKTASRTRSTTLRCAARPSART